jgi:hypothetical protein
MRKFLVLSTIYKLGRGALPAPPSSCKGGSQRRPSPRLPAAASHHLPLYQDKVVTPTPLKDIFTPIWAGPLRTVAPEGANSVWVILDRAVREGLLKHHDADHCADHRQNRLAGTPSCAADFKQCRFGPDLLFSNFNRAAFSLDCTSMALSESPFLIRCESEGESKIALPDVDFSYFVDYSWRLECLP